jgi:hypothetical protein
MNTEKDKTTRRQGDAEIERLPTVEGELLETFNHFDEEETVVPRAERTVLPPALRKPKPTKIEVPLTKEKTGKTDQKSVLLYLVAPLLFLTVALFGGLRFADADNAFLFLKPALVCLIFAAILIVLFFRANLLRLEGWFSEDFTLVKNIANGAVLLTLFAASVQIFNALLPERGLPFWTVAFCFFWTLWNNIFAEFEVKRLLKSLGALFGLAFLVKYVLLASLTAPSAESWWQAIWQNPAKEAFTWALDLPRFAAATGYLQFFTLAFYLLGLFLLAPTTAESGRVKR